MSERAPLKVLVSSTQRPGASSVSRQVCVSADLLARASHLLKSHAYGDVAPDDSERLAREIDRASGEGAAVIEEVLEKIAGYADCDDGIPNDAMKAATLLQGLNP